MDKLFSIKGIWIEIIEIFGELLVIQEIVSKVIRIIFYYELDQINEDSKIEDKSNVYTFRGWKECRKNEENLKRASLPQRPRPSPKPRLFPKPVLVKS